MMRKKICFVTTIGGTIRAFLLGLTKYLINDNYDVTFICSPDEELEKLQEEYIHFIPIKMSRGVNFDAFRVIPKLISIFKKEKFDIVQYATPNAALYASIASKRAGIKNRLYTQWGIRYMGYERGIKRSIFKWMEKITCRNSSVIECESHSLYKFSLDERLYEKSNASVIGKGSACGVDLVKFDISKHDIWRVEIRNKFNISSDSLVFGYMGRLTKDKGINELISSFKSFFEKHNDSYLFLVGNYDNESSIDENLLVWANSCSHVYVPGRTTESEKYYSAMDVFCSLSYREGFGLVVIEAAAMGVPAIVTDVPGQIDTIVDNVTGLSVPAKNTLEVVKAMNYYYDNKESILLMGRHARKNVEDNYDSIKLFAELANHRNSIID